MNCGVGCGVATGVGCTGVGVGVLAFVAVGVGVEATAAATCVGEGVPEGGDCTWEIKTGFRFISVPDEKKYQPNKTSIPITTTTSNGGLCLTALPHRLKKTVFFLPAW